MLQGYDFYDCAEMAGAVGFMIWCMVWLYKNQSYEPMEEEQQPLQPPIPTAKPGEPGYRMPEDYDYNYYGAGLGLASSMMD